MLDSLVPGASVFIQGASRGIGLAFVRQILADDRVAHVFASCSSPAAAETLTELAQHDARLHVLELDVTHEASIAAAIHEIKAITSRLHLTVVCAGVLHDVSLRIRPERRLSEVEANAVTRSFEVNALGPLLIAKHAEPLFAHTDRAIFASLSARVGSIGDNRLGGWYAYRASKAAQNMFTKTLSIEWARSRRNVICVALHPGTTDTDLSRPFQANVPADKLFTAERAARYLLGVIDGLRPEDSGRFFAWDGSEIAW